jgi:hypothetical protein
MSYENKTGLNVSNQYGARSTGLTAGIDDDFDELTIELTGDGLNNIFLPPVVIPKNSRMQRATLHVDQAFVLGGTAPTVQVGGTLPGTNGITLTATDLGSVGAKDVASELTGTWATNSAAGITANERVTIALGGTSPTVTPGVGKATLWIEFRYKART